jgi:hypothetical protein
MKKIFFTAAAAVLAFTAAAWAQKSANPCEAAGKQFCSASKNFREFIGCLEQNKASLSASCRSRVDFALEMGKKFQEKRSACKKEADTLCKGAGDRTFNCLLRNQEKASAACKKDLKDWKRSMDIIPQSLRDKVMKEKKATAPAKKN